MGDRERHRCRERLVSLATADVDPDDARQTAIGELRRATGFSRWCWPLTDPDSGLSTSGIGEVDFWPSLPRMVALEEHGDVTRKPRLVIGPMRSAALSLQTAGDLERSPRWRECLHPYGIGDELMTACRDSRGCWGSVELMRESGDKPFSDKDAQFLHELSPLLGAIVRRSLARTWRAPGESAGPPPPATVIVDAGLAAIATSDTLAEWRAELPSAGPGGILPPVVYELAARVLTPAESAVPLPPRVRIRLARGRWSVIEAARLRGDDAAGVAVTVRGATSGEIFDLLCKTHDLTARERQLVAMVRAGLSTRALAGALGISAYTIQDHLKSVFAKAGVRSRRELMSRMAE